MAETSGSKTWMMLISAILFGLAAAGLSVLYLNAREAAILESLLGDEEVLMTVIVANRDLPKGTRLEEEYLSTMDMPAKFVADSTLTLDNFENHLGQFLNNYITAGKPVVASDIDEKFPRDFSDLIEAGHRALTVQVDEVNSISGMLRPGNKVDIYVIIQAKTTGYKPATTTAAALPTALSDSAIQAAAQAAGLPAGIDLPTDQLKGLVDVQEKPKDVIMPVVQDVRVLAAGQEAYRAYLDQYQLPQFRTEAGFAAVTLDVTPKQAALLSLADDKGDLVAILRHRDDRGLADFDGITPFDLVKEAARMKKQSDRIKAAAAAGLTIDENGNYVDANGNIIAKEDLIFNADGSVTTKQALMEAAGYTMNENGEWVDKDGNVIDPDDIVVLANGTVMTKDGKIISGPNVKVNKHGCLIAGDGTVMTKSGEILSGVFVDENDNVIGPDGNIMTDCDLTVAADGTVRDKYGNIIEGITGGEAGIEKALDILLGKGPISLIIGGSSTDGKAKRINLPIESIDQILSEDEDKVSDDVE
jgi:pilus assembly protein CpaB